MLVAAGGGWNAPALHHACVTCVDSGLLIRLPSAADNPSLSGNAGWQKSILAMRPMMLDFLRRLMYRFNICTSQGRALEQ